MSLRSQIPWTPQEDEILLAHLNGGREAIRRALNRAGYSRSLNAIKDRLDVLLGKK